MRFRKLKSMKIKVTLLSLWPYWICASIAIALQSILRTSSLCASIVFTLQSKYVAPPSKWHLLLEFFSFFHQFFDYSIFQYSLDFLVCFLIFMVSKFTYLNSWCIHLRVLNSFSLNSSCISNAIQMNQSHLQSLKQSLWVHVQDQLCAFPFIRSIGLKSYSFIIAYLFVPHNWVSSVNKDYQNQAFCTRTSEVKLQKRYGRLDRLAQLSTGNVHQKVRDAFSARVL